MKRITAWMLTMVLVLWASVTAFATEASPGGDNRQTHIGVYARYVDSTQWNTLCVDENGQAATRLPDGTEISVSGAVQPGWQLVIDPITEKDALDWIRGVLDGKAKDLSPLHIYFIDGKGNTKTSDGVTVTVKRPGNLTAPVAYSLTDTGDGTSLTLMAGEGALTFTTDGSPYYVLGEKVRGNTSSGETPSDPGNSPPTGDTGPIGLWFALLTVSGMGWFGAVSRRKKQGPFRNNP